MIGAWTRQLARAAGRALLLAAVSAVAGLGFNRIRPVGIPLRIDTEPAAATDTDGGITVAEAEERIGLILFVDARSRAAYAEGHLPGAVSLPNEEFEPAYGEVAGQLVAGVPLVAYCEGGDCTVSHSLAKALRQGGYDDVRVLTGGIEAWQEAGLPLEPGW